MYVTTVFTLALSLCFFCSELRGDGIGRASAEQGQDQTVQATGEFSKTLLGAKGGKNKAGSPSSFKNSQPFILVVFYHAPELKTRRKS